MNKYKLTFGIEHNDERCREIYKLLKMKNKI